MYYHYTNRCGAMAISSSGFLQPSQQSGGFGAGVYLTDLDPHQFFRDEILMNNYGGIRTEFHNRADWVVEVTSNNIDVQLLRRVYVHGDTNRRIFVYPYCISVSRDQIYDKPRCVESFANSTYTSSDTDDECSEIENASDEHETVDTGSNNYDSGDEVNSCDEYGSDENRDGYYTSGGEENRSHEYESNEDSDNFGSDNYNSEDEEDICAETGSDENEGSSSTRWGETDGNDENESNNDGDGSYSSYDDDSDYSYESSYGDYSDYCCECENDN